jgi:UDP-N-acetylmuramoylalanine-D-glutamate ligase
VPTTLTESLEEATCKAFVAAKNSSLQTVVNSFVLLSPAASSFDTFANFEERGKQFTALAKKLCQQHPNSVEVR